jgi:hypothetical protein
MTRTFLLLAALAGATGCQASGNAKAGMPDAGPDTRAPAAPDGGKPEAGAVAQPSPPESGADDSLPASSSDDLTTRARHLLEAIRHDDPGLATDIVFPRDAYLQVKDAPDPGRQWDTRVITRFQRQVHALHRRTRGIDRAQFVTFEIGEPVVQAVPKKHDLKRTLWHVRHSRLTYTIDGKAMHFDMSEMLSWRGAWYVTRLRGNN